MKTINYIEITLSDYSVFRINYNNVLEFNIQTYQDVINMEKYTGCEIDSLTKLIRNMLLVVEDFNKIINVYDEEEFDVDDMSICQVNIMYDDGKNELLYVDMTDEDYNRNQLNVIENNRLFISIDTEI